MSTVLDKDAAAAAPAQHHTRAERKQSDKKHPHRGSHTAVVLGVGFALWLYLGLVGLHLLHNPALTLPWILLGAALVPATVLWIMSHRLSVTDTITASKLVQTTIIGGFFALAIGGTLDSLTGMIPQSLAPGTGDGVVQLALAGFVEEFAKAALVVILGWNVAKTARNGLFLGGAVGIGFAILENTFYIGSHFVGNSPVAEAMAATITRNLTAPILHMTLSAILGAAIFAAAGRANRNFSLTLSVVGAYVLVAAIHGIYDGGAPLIGVVTGAPAFDLLGEIVLMPGMMIAGILVWRHVARKNQAAPAPEVNA